MKRILLDEDMPLQLVDAAPPHCNFGHVPRVGWAHMLDGGLLAKAERVGDDVLPTADRSIGDRRNLRVKRIAPVVLTTDNWRVIRANAPSSFARAIAADVAAIALPHPARSI